MSALPARPPNRTQAGRTPSLPPLLGSALLCAPLLLLRSTGHTAALLDALSTNPATGHPFATMGQLVLHVAALISLVFALAGLAHWLRRRDGSNKDAAAPAVLPGNRKALVRRRAERPSPAPADVGRSLPPRPAVTQRLRSPSHHTGDSPIVDDLVRCQEHLRMCPRSHIHIHGDALGVLCRGYKPFSSESVPSRISVV